MFAFLFKKCIKLYWKYIPESQRKICIFRLTCSNAVYQKLENEGFFAGLKLYFYRRKNCKEGYHFFVKNDNVYINTKENEIIEENEINPLLLNEYKIHI
jgi:putative component of membrane protein insertase Oxa1/YidC/SpoIIIJ protein YidD